MVSLLYGRVWLLSVDTHFRDIFSTSPIQPRPTSLWAQFMYYILFYSFKYGPSPFDLLGKLRKYSMVGIGRFLSHLLHEPNTSVLPSGQGTLVAPQAHDGALIPKIFILKQFLCSGWLWSNVFVQNIFFPLKMVGSFWPTSATSPHSNEPPNGLKQ